MRYQYELMTRVVNSVSCILHGTRHMKSMECELSFIQHKTFEVHVVVTYKHFPANSYLVVGW